MKIAIIGCGTVCAVYLQALEYLFDQIEVVALCDEKVENALRFQSSHMQIYESFQELLRDISFDAAIISTPLQTHTAIARECLLRGKHVLLEKPAALSVSDIQGLYWLALENNVVFQVAMHAAMASEITWYLEKLSPRHPRYSAGNISQITCAFHDPYLTAGRIADHHKALGGSFLDSGINALSVCERLVSLGNMQLLAHREKRTEDEIIYASETQFYNGRVRLLLNTAWDIGINQKHTVLSFYNTSDRLILDHSAQEVRQINAKGAEHLLYRDASCPRLVNHYIQVFQSFVQRIDQPFPTDGHRTIAVHDLLLRAHFSDNR